MTNLLHHKLEAQALQQALRLLNPWQRDFPLVPRPFSIIGQTLGLSEQAVLDQLQALQEGGALSRVGGVFAAFGAAVPAPPTIAGVAGILGITLGFIIVNGFRA